MKFYEALTELHHNPKGYVIESCEGSWCMCVIVDKDGKFRSPSFYGIISGYKGYRLSIYGSMNGLESLFNRDFLFFTKFTEVCREFFKRTVENTYSRWSAEEIKSSLLKAQKKHLLSKEEVLMLTQEYERMLGNDNN